MPARNSPLKTNKSAPMYTKRTSGSLKRSLSESSADELHRNSSSSSQNNDIHEKHRLTRQNMAGLPQGTTLLKTHKGEQKTCSGKAFNCSLAGLRYEYISDLIDIGIRVILVIVFSKLETTSAFKRIIHIEEMWLYKNPRTSDIVSARALLLSVTLSPLVITLLHFVFTRDSRDFRAASWAWTLILGLNGLATSLLKITVGRPRPDYYYRCFPDGVMRLNKNVSTSDNMLDLFNCTGNAYDINEGYKSFPSGHSSFAFASFGFITFYLGAKLQVFSGRRRGESWRLCIAITPLIVAALIAVSRACDYHHHWQDIMAGGVIGLFISYLVYRQYYPSIFARNCYRSLPCDELDMVTHPKYQQQTQRRRLHSYKRLPSEETGDATVLCASDDGNSDCKTNENECRPLIHEQKTNNKWF